MYQCALEGCLLTNKHGQAYSLLLQSTECLNIQGHLKNKDGNTSCSSRRAYQSLPLPSPLQQKLCCQDCTALMSALLVSHCQPANKPLLYAPVIHLALLTRERCGVVQVKYITWVWYGICLKCSIAKNVKFSVSSLQHLRGLGVCAGSGLRYCHGRDMVLDQSGLLDKQAPVLRLWNKAPFSLGDGSDRPEREKSPSSTWQRAGTRSQQNQIEEVRESVGKSYLSGQACAQNSSCFCLLSSTNLGAKCIRDIRCPSSNLLDKRIRWAESCFACVLLFCFFFVTPIAVEIEVPTSKLFSIVDGLGFLPSVSLNSSDEI